MTEEKSAQQQQRLHPGLLSTTSPPAPRRSSRGVMGKGRQVELEKVLGITVISNSALTCDPSSGLVAYPAGCVIVLLCPRKNKQSHIFNTSSKHLSALSFSPDGKLIVSGESGHNPAVRVWDVAEKVQVSEMLGHKYGVSCVCFSPSMKYVVSVGYQHDMVVNVWDWKNNNIVAKNKVSSKVSAVSFSEDSSYFVTVGHRHVKFWYLESSKQSQVNGTVPLVGRSGLLGDLNDNVFVGVACGRGRNAGSTYCVSYSGLLCQFNEKRVLEKWLKLKMSSSCLCVTEELVFCGCEQGVIRMFTARNLQYVTDLPKPHALGADLALGLNAGTLLTEEGNSGYPDTCAVVYDGGKQWLCCVYNDHSIYVWDVRNSRKVGKVYSALYHSSYVWNLEVYPESGHTPYLPHGSFFTCSSDNTLRFWSSDLGMKRNVYSNDLYKVIYVNDRVGYLKDSSGTMEKPESKDYKSGVRVLKIHHDGRQLASGDRTGNIRIYDLETFEELLTIEAHDGEVLCLEYSKPWTGVTLLASASRDRLIHILDVGRDYTLLQTLDDHSSSITAVKFAVHDDQMHMISCGADKSIYFRPAQMLSDGISFVRLHHVVEKTTLYDLDVDVTQKTAAVACQDKTVRLYNISSGKQEKALRGSPSTGALLKVQMDPSGRFFATSCSNKNISIFDLHTGECVAVMYGHSDIVTDMMFTNDCRRLITVSGDSCIFVWQLDPAMTMCMRQQLTEVAAEEMTNLAVDVECPANTRRDSSFMIGPLDESSSDVLFLDRSGDDDETSPCTPVNDGFEADPTVLQSNGKFPLWARKLLSQDKEQNDPLVAPSPHQYRPQGRWAESEGTALIRNFLNDNIGCYSTPNYEQGESFFLDEDTASEPKTLELEDGNDVAERIIITEASSASEDADFQSQCSESNSTYLKEDSDFAIEEPTFDEVCDSRELLSASDSDEDSLTSGDDMEENIRSETPEEERYLKQHFDTLSEEKFDNTLADLKPDEEDEMLNPRLSLSSKFFSQCQRMVRAGYDFTYCIPQVATGVGMEPEGSQRLPDINSEKSPDTQEIIRGTSKSRSSLQNSKSNEKPSSSRSSFPGCWPNKCKPNKGRSYMEATASFKAKISRSASMGDNIHTAEDPRRMSRISRPLSSTDLSSLGQNKLLPAENSDKPPQFSTSYEQEKVKYSVGSSNQLSDTLLMPPPSTCGIVPRLKKKAKSVNNLSKMSRKENTNGRRSKGGDFLNRRSSSSTNRPADIQDLPRRASIAAIPSHASFNIHTSSYAVEEPLPSSGTSSSSQVSSCSSHGEPNADVLASRCERVVEDLHNAFQKALQAYKEMKRCAGSEEQKYQLGSLFDDAFDKIGSEIDVVRVGRRNSRRETTPTMQLLEHYSDMMLQLLKEKMADKE